MLSRIKAKQLAGKWFRGHYKKAGRIWKFSHVHRTINNNGWYLIANAYCGYIVDIIVWDTGIVEHA